MMTPFETRIGGAASARAATPMGGHGHDSIGATACVIVGPESQNSADRVFARSGRAMEPADMAEERDMGTER